MWGIDAASYLDSLGLESLIRHLMLGTLTSFSEAGSEGKAGGLFYFSSDNHYMLKTIREDEHKMLRQVRLISFCFLLFFLLFTHLFRCFSIPFWFISMCVRSFRRTTTTGATRPRQRRGAMWTTAMQKGGLVLGNRKGGPLYCADTAACIPLLLHPAPRYIISLSLFLYLSTSLHLSLSHTHTHAHTHTSSTPTKS